LQLTLWAAGWIGADIDVQVAVAPGLVQKELNGKTAADDCVAFGEQFA